MNIVIILTVLLLAFYEKYFFAQTALSFVLKGNNVAIFFAQTVKKMIESTIKEN